MSKLYVFMWTLPTPGYMNCEMIHITTNGPQIRDYMLVLKDNVLTKKVAFKKAMPTFAFKLLNMKVISLIRTENYETGLKN